MVTGLALSNPVMADRNIKPDRVTIAKASMTVAPGKEFEIKATMSPRNAEDEYLRWEILSGKDVIRFDDDDRNDDEIEFKALKEGSASVRCYVKGRDKTKYGDTIKISIQKKKLLRQSFRLCQRSFLFLLLSYASLECFIFRNTGT